MSSIKDQQYYLIYQKIIDAKRNTLYLPVKVAKGLKRTQDFINLHKPKQRKIFGYIPTFKKEINEEKQIPLTKNNLFNKFAQKLIF